MHTGDGYDLAALGQKPIYLQNQLTYTIQTTNAAVTITSDGQQTTVENR
jgi:hypothetical protein